LQVAVVGAGAAGLVCARELVRKGHSVTVFEQSRELGGVWVYRPEVEDDPLGRRPSRRVFSSMYDSLRTNLPRDLMAFRDYTFDSNGGGDDRWPRFPHHSKVLVYLQNFARDFGIFPLIRFSETIAALEPTGDDAWTVQLSDGTRTQFDAVAVCNGHYAAPRVARIPGMDQFRGQLLHSHNYRNPDDFHGKRVALLGTAASGADLAREIATVADQVYWCGKSFARTQRITNNLDGFPVPTRFLDGHSLQLADGSTLKQLDAFIFCTGYEVEFPFLDDEILQVNDNWAHPLYLDVLSPTHRTLGLIGLPFVVIPFPLFEMQAKWFAAAMSGDVELPDQEHMLVLLDQHRDALERDNEPMHHYHKLGEQQFAYTDMLARQCGGDPVPEWFIELARESGQSRLDNPANFRDLPLHSRNPQLDATRS